MAVKMRRQPAAAAAAARNTTHIEYTYTRTFQHLTTCLPTGGRKKKKQRGK